MKKILVGLVIVMLCLTATETFARKQRRGPFQDRLELQRTPSPKEQLNINMRMIIRDKATGLPIPGVCVQFLSDNSLPLREKNLYIKNSNTRGEVYCGLPSGTYWAYYFKDGYYPDKRISVRTRESLFARTIVALYPMRPLSSTERNVNVTFRVMDVISSSGIPDVLVTVLKSKSSDNWADGMQGRTDASGTFTCSVPAGVVVLPKASKKGDLIPGLLTFNVRTTDSSHIFRLANKPRRIINLR